MNINSLPVIRLFQSHVKLEVLERVVLRIPIAVLFKDKIILMVDDELIKVKTECYRYT